MTEEKIGLVLLAGGQGARMQTPLPKQFLLLDEKPIAQHSLDILLKCASIVETVIVCASEYRESFNGYHVAFADPGTRRQDSLYNGLKCLSSTLKWVCVHDAARPFITLEMLERLIASRNEVKAATLAVPVKSTIKETCENAFVTRTLERSSLWEIQTPQLVSKEVLEAGFGFAIEHALTVTDDVSLAELIGHPVKLVFGGYQNIKITTPEDLLIAQCLNIK